MKIRILTFILAIMWISVNAQDEDHNPEHEQKDDEHVHHSHHPHEIGIANGLVYFVGEGEFSYGLHAHYIYSIASTKFGIGLGYEKIFDDHEHTTLGIVGSYRPFDGLSLNVAPGFTFEGGDTSELLFAIHLEATYEFEIGNFHIGPVLEFAYDPEDIHLSLGLHLGYGF